MSEESEKALRHRASLLSSLPGIEAFQALSDETERKRLRMVESVMTRVMSGEQLEVIQRQVDYDRGFIDGMRYLVSGLPSGATRMLMRLEEGLQAQSDEPEFDLWSYEEEPRE